MAIKPILFNTPMVRAILDGRKTCTRRLMKRQPQSKLCYTFAGSDSSPYVAVTLGRRGIGFELKESYYKQAVANLEIAANADKMNCPVGQMSIEDFLSESLA